MCLNMQFIHVLYGVKLLLYLLGLLATESSVQLKWKTDRYSDIWM